MKPLVIILDMTTIHNNVLRTYMKEMNNASANSKCYVILEPRILESGRPLSSEKAILRTFLRFDSILSSSSRPILSSPPISKSVVIRMGLFIKVLMKSRTFGIGFIRGLRLKSIIELTAHSCSSICERFSMLCLTEPAHR